MERSMRARIVSVGILVLVLVAGFLMGVAWARSGAGGSGEPAAAAARGGTRSGQERTEGRRGGSRRSLLVEQVGLSEEQKQTVDSIVDFYRSRMRALHEEFNSEYTPRYRRIVEEARESIRKILTPEQRVQYDSILAERDRRRESRRSGGRRNDDGT